MKKLSLDEWIQQRSEKTWRFNCRKLRTLPWEPQPSAPLQVFTHEGILYLLVRYGTGFHAGNVELSANIEGIALSTYGWRTYIASSIRQARKLCREGYEQSSR